MDTQHRPCHDSDEKYFCHSTAHERAPALHNPSNSGIFPLLPQTAGVSRPLSGDIRPSWMEALSAFYNGLASGEDITPFVILLQDAMRLHLGVATTGAKVDDGGTPCLHQGMVNEGAPSFCVTSGTKSSLRDDIQTHPSWDSSKGQGTPAVPLAAAQQRHLYAAALSALLFAVESEAALAQATYLYHFHCVRDTPERAPAATPSGYGRANSIVTHAIRTGHAGLFVCDRVTLDLARRLHRVGDWMQALRMLAEAPPTPAAGALMIGVCRHTTLWQTALIGLSLIPPCQWTEVDVSGVACALYHAALKERYHTRRDAPCRRRHEVRPHSKIQDHLVDASLNMLKQAREATVQWSTPSAINDALGVLGMRPERWRDACTLLDSVVLKNADASVASTGFSAEHSASELQKGPSSTLLHSTMCGGEMRQAAQLTRNLSGIPANAVTVCQACRALRSNWLASLYYAGRLVEQNTIPLEMDRGAMEGCLRACIRGGRWIEAAHLVQRQNQQYSVVALDASRTSLGRPHYGEWATRMPSSSSAPYGSDVFLSLLRLLVSHQCMNVAYRLARRSEELNYYPVSTISRAYNCLLQHAATLEEASKYTQHLRTTPTGGGYKTESAAFERLVCLYARDGQWWQALNSLQILLDDRQGRSRYVPSAQVHDAVQYALEQAPLCASSWQVSLTLFSNLCERQVPLSEVAFRCVVKRCFAQGASEQAQALFLHLMKKGVRR